MFIYSITTLSKPERIIPTIGILRIIFPRLNGSSNAENNNSRLIEIFIDSAYMLFFKA